MDDPSNQKPDARPSVKDPRGVILGLGRALIGAFAGLVVVTLTLVIASSNFGLITLKEPATSDPFFWFAVGLGAVGFCVRRGHLGQDGDCQGKAGDVIKGMLAGTAAGVARGSGITIGLGFGNGRGRPRYLLRWAAGSVHRRHDLGAARASAVPAAEARRRRVISSTTTCPAEPGFGPGRSRHRFLLVRSGNIKATPNALIRWTGRKEDSSRMMELRRYPSGFDCRPGVAVPGRPTSRTCNPSGILLRLVARSLEGCRDETKSGHHPWRACP